MAETARSFFETSVVSPPAKTSTITLADVYLCVCLYCICVYTPHFFCVRGSISASSVGPGGEVVWVLGS